MDSLEFLDIIRDLYNSYPIITSLIFGFVVMVMGIQVYQRYVSSYVSDIRYLDVFYQEKRKAFGAGIMFIVYVFFTLYVYYGNDLQNLFSMTGTVDIRLEFFRALVYSAIILLLIFGSRKIGTVFTSIYKENSYLKFVLLMIWGLFFNLVFLEYAVFITNTFLRCIIVSALSSFILANYAINLAGDNTYTKISNGECEFFVYYKYGNYYMCGNSPSKYSLSGKFLLSNEVIVKEKYFFYSGFVEPICYTRVVRDNLLSSMKKYDIFIKGDKYSLPVQKITLIASYRDISGEEIYNRKYYFEGVVHPGEEKRVRRIKIKSRRVFQCKLNVIDYKIAEENNLLGRDLDKYD